MVDGSGRVGEDRHIPVPLVVAAVLGDLAAAGVDDADLDAAEHVWVARVGVGGPKKSAASCPA